MPDKSRDIEPQTPKSNNPIKRTNINIQTHHRLIAHANLASASIRFLAAFSAGVSARLGALTCFVRFVGNSDLSSDVVDRAVDVELMDMASLSNLESMLGRYELDMMICWKRRGAVAEVRVRISEM